MVHVTEPNGVMAVEYRRALSNVLVMRCKMKSPSPNVTDMTAVFKLRGEEIDKSKQVRLLSGRTRRRICIEMQLSRRLSNVVHVFLSSYMIIGQKGHWKIRRELLIARTSTVHV